MIANTDRLSVLTMIAVAVAVNYNTVFRKLDLYPKTISCSYAASGTSGKHSFIHYNASSMSNLPVMVKVEVGTDIN